jgi:high-affinity iron transporter
MWPVCLRWFVVLLFLQFSAFCWAETTRKVQLSSPTDSLPAQQSSQVTKESQELLKIRRLVLLSEYISADYALAVSPSHEVLSEEEFAEMLEFSSTMNALYEELPQKSENLTREIEELKTLVFAKSSPQLVAKKALDISEALKKYHALETYLKTFPSLAHGKKHFETHCASCHGATGDAKTPLAATLKIPPRNLLEEEFVEKLSPSKVHNTLKLGIPETGMISYEGILDEESMWDVSFYVASLPFQREYKKPSKSEFSKNVLFELSWQDLADKRLGELRTFLQNIYPNKDPSEFQDELVLMRTLNFNLSDLPFLEIDEPASHDESSSLEYLLLTKSKLSEAVDNLNKGDFGSLPHKILDAYLEGFENFERELKILSPKKLKELEHDFMELRSLASKDPKNETILSHLKNLDLKLSELEALMTKKTEKRGFLFFSDVMSSATIILREGVEAFLIVIALLSLVQNLGMRKAKVWIHSAWILAIISGFITYYFLHKVFEISGANRELLEAFFTGIAVLMLFYTGFWLLSQSNSIKWTQFVKGGSKEELSQGNIFAFFSLAFIAVYREAAETVLFYQALLSTTSHVSSVVVGFFVGVLLLLALCLGILYYNIKIPMKKFFKLTSGLMFLLSFVLMGKAVYELIEANYVTHTPWNFVPHFEALGLYPFRETTLAQCLLLLTTGILLWRFRRKSERPTSLKSYS